MNVVFLNLNNPPTALGFRFTSPLTSDERSERNAQARNCIFAHEWSGPPGEAKYNPARAGRFLAPLAKACAQPDGV